ncbi:endo-1,3(4)-beta-glucanase [Lobosporangium transversale]|uniref:glucan endo-1,3-beta-D-glucosidase n=1 Tax=Lobosporangium transversale TaxID=64571 RepID=A0A1Y2GEC0_9FUNG|nr:endo-1,3(4)-beta-glucanase [Lobosporangium transversale]ORZ07014.1 endo-1,3(4)-beta-glucanase [Lobosporangium transversale]|eukprot:XP_021877810.1 endo-1,3(4)-beta-glucanase [Lobosporangium transversale]
MRIQAKDRARSLPTNKFYGNLMLDDSHAPVWTHPYGLRWDGASLGQQGLGISHIDDDMKVFGPSQDFSNPTEEGGNNWGDDTSPGSSKYYLNPFLVSMGLSAAEFDTNHQMSVGDFEEFGCTMLLFPDSEGAQGRQENPRSFIRVPIVRGMAFITGIYRDLTPQVYSETLVRTLERDLNLSSDRVNEGWVKYRFLIENGVTWLLYARPLRVKDGPLQLEKKEQRRVVSTSGKFTGLIQIAKLPIGNEVETERLYDQAVGVYTTGGHLSVLQKNLKNDAGGYRIDWKLAGDISKKFIHFTLPHHREILTDIAVPTSVTLPSTTKGKMVAYEGPIWFLYEPERLKVGLLPESWSEVVTSERLIEIRQQAERDAELDFDLDADLDSMYFSGKRLAKFALLSLVVIDVIGDRNGPLYEKCLWKLKRAFERFLDNKQQYRLVYDKTWRGLISIQGLEKGALADFGNSWYNDHHYHYGYFIHTAAIIRHLDPKWRTSDVSAFVNSLVRDVANPSKDDPYFPVFRSFDWFMGHSWSQGIFVSLDGKDEESTSEDINFYYAMSLWGRMDNQPELERLGQLMLTIARRSIQAYFLLENDNMNHPRAFIGNKVTGILFENKVDHTTYFSSRIECIQGIQMIPATPALPLVRRRKFVQEEWESLLKSRVGYIEDGWKSILMMNYATLDKEAAWQYFSVRDGGRIPLDDGLTLTWALFYVASMNTCSK